MSVDMCNAYDGTYQTVFLFIGFIDRDDNRFETKIKKS